MRWPTLIAYCHWVLCDAWRRWSTKYVKWPGRGVPASHHASSRLVPTLFSGPTQPGAPAPLVLKTWAIGYGWDELAPLSLWCRFLHWSPFPDLRPVTQAPAASGPSWLAGEASALPHAPVLGAEDECSSVLRPATVAWSRKDGWSFENLQRSQEAASWPEEQPW